MTASPAMQAFLSLLRSVLMVFGTYAVAKGWVDPGTAAEIIAASAVVVPAAYGLWKNYQAEKKTQAREMAAVNAGVAIAKAEPDSVGDSVRPQDVKQIIKDFAPTTQEPAK